MKYKSKHSLVLVAIFDIILLGLIGIAILDSNWFLFIITIVTAFFIIHLFKTTYYTITDDALIVKSGFLYNISIPISSITKIEKTSSLLSAPATSFKRIEVFYGKFDSVIVSPEKQTEFIEHLKRINPQIISK